MSNSMSMAVICQEILQEGTKVKCTKIFVAHAIKQGAADKNMKKQGTNFLEQCDNEGNLSGIFCFCCAKWLKNPV